jgi:hypothetical protein
MAKNIFQAGVTPGPSQEAIAQRAHEIWESEGRPEGRATEHWYRAVSEVKAQSDGEMRASELSTEKPRTSRRSSPRVAEKQFQTTGR